MVVHCNRCRVLEQYKADLAKRRLGEGGSSGLLASLSAGCSDQQCAQQQWQQQQAPPQKRARVGSSSDLTSGAHRCLDVLPMCSLASCGALLWSYCPLSLAGITQRSPHVVLLHSVLLPCRLTLFGSSLRHAGGSMALSASIREGDRNVLKLKFARPRKDSGGAQHHEEQLTEYQRSRPRRQVDLVGGNDVLLAMQCLPCDSTCWACQSACVCSILLAHHICTICVFCLNSCRCRPHPALAHWARMTSTHCSHWRLLPPG